MEHRWVVAHDGSDIVDPYTDEAMILTPEAMQSLQDNPIARTVGF